MHAKQTIEGTTPVDVILGNAVHAFIDKNGMAPGLILLTPEWYERTSQRMREVAAFGNECDSGRRSFMGIPIYVGIDLDPHDFVIS